MCCCCPLLVVFAQELLFRSGLAGLTANSFLDQQIERGKTGNFRESGRSFGCATVQDCAARAGTALTRNFCAAGTTATASVQHYR